MMRGLALLPIALVLANLSALAISVAIPNLVSADQYSVFALCWSIGQLVASVAFDWMRYGVMRHSIGQDSVLANQRALILWKSYFLVAAGILLVAVAGALVSTIWQFAAYLAAVMFYAACQGSFEGRQALARAEENHVYYSLSWVFRTFISLILSSVAAWWTGSGVFALVGLAASYPLTWLIINRSFKFVPPRTIQDRDHLLFLMRYGVFAALATILSMLLASSLRVVAVIGLGMTEAGGLLLAIDLSQKAISVVGLAVNVVMMQMSIRSVEFQSFGESQLQATRHIAVAAAMVVPAAVGFYLMQDQFAPLIVQEEYLSSYMPAIGWACLAAAVLSFRQFSIDSLFVAFGQTKNAVVAPLFTMISTVASVLLLQYFNLHSAVTITAAFAICTIAGAASAAFALNSVRSIVWPVLDFLKTGVCVAVMALVYGAFAGHRSTAVQLLAVIVCGTSYVVAAVGLNLSGSRTIAAKIITNARLTWSTRGNSRK